jgi:hypothetical protein
MQVTMPGSSLQLPLSVFSHCLALWCFMLVSCATAIGVLELSSYRFRYRQDEMGHQFGLYGHLCLRLSHGVLERVGLRDVVWGTNDTWIGGNT